MAFLTDLRKCLVGIWRCDGRPGKSGQKSVLLVVAGGDLGYPDCAIFVFWEHRVSFVEVRLDSLTYHCPRHPRGSILVEASGIRHVEKTDGEEAFETMHPGGCGNIWEESSGRRYLGMISRRIG